MGERARLCRHVSAGPGLVDRPPGAIPRGVDFLPFPLQRLALADAKPEGKAGIIDAAQHAVGAELHLAIAAQRLGDRLKGGAIRHAIDGFPQLAAAGQRRG